MTNDSAVDLAAEIARLEALFGPEGAMPALPAASESPSVTLAGEIRRGPLARLLEETDRTGQLALRKAKAVLAAHDARQARRRSRYPPWMGLVLTAVISLILGIAVPPWLNLVTSRHDAVRKQADVLLVQLSNLVIRARELQNRVGFAEERGLIKAQADRLRREAVELEQSFGAATQLHDFRGVADLRSAELRAFFEIRALQDCLETAEGKTPKATWRQIPEVDPRLLAGASSQPPCAAAFDVAAFDDFTNAVDAEIASRIGGSLFPRRSGTKR